MPRLWTWLGVLALFAGAVGLADQFGGPVPAAAQGGAELSQPIPPATGLERVGSIRNQIGWTTAKKRWGWNMPLGKDVVVGQAEPGGNGYLANTKHRDLPGTGFIPESGATSVSGHATTVARHAFGPDSAGQGVRAVHAWSTDDWLRSGYLNTGTALPPRDDHDARVFNHSWIADSASAPAVLRRVDYAVDQNDVLIVCGVNNQSGKIPAMLASAYNVISVGRAVGENSDDLTTADGEGRCKPELVAPGKLTSWSTGVVTGGVAALLEVADRKAGITTTQGLGKPDEDADSGGEGETKRNEHAVRSEVIKAVLLAGAHKPEGWAPPEGEPLDRKLGAGVMDLDRSIIILEAGAAKPNAQHTQRYGWSFAQIDPGKSADYRFTVDKTQGESTFALTWHRRVVGPVSADDPVTGEKREAWDARAFIPNLDLSLIRTDAEGNEEVVATSASGVDNVELLVLPELAPGQYTLRIQRKQDNAPMPWDFAAAWRVEAVE